MESNLRMLQSFKKINEKIDNNHEEQKEINEKTDNSLKYISNEIKEISKENDDLKEKLTETIEKVKQEKPKDGRDGKNGKDGLNGKDGKDGKDGQDGKNGLNGKDGKDGKNGKDGKDGINGNDGVSVYDAEINEKGELILKLTNGKRINCGIVKGKDGFSFAGVSVTNAEIVDGELIITLSTGKKINAGKVTGEIANESDPIFTNSAAYNITANDINNWDNKLDEETDPTVPQYVKDIKEEDIENWNNKVTDSDYVHTDNNLTDELKEQIALNKEGLEEANDKILNLDEAKAEISYVENKVNMFHATIDNSNFQYVKGSADFTYEDVVNTENCIIEVQVANEKVYMAKQEFKNINPPDPIAGRYVGFSQMIRVAGEMAELFLFVYDHENLPTDEESLNRLENWGDYQYCQSSYQPVVMGNFLVTDIEANRSKDTNAPSAKASGDYTDKKCGVVLDYMQTTFAQNIMALAGLTFTKKPEIVYDNATGFEASNSDAGDTWHLTGLDLSKYKRLKFYVKASGSSDDNFTPSHIVEMHLDERAKDYGNVYVAGHISQNPNNRNRLHMVTFAVNAEKTAVQFCHATSLYGTAATNSSGSRTCYLIEGYYD